MLSMMIFFEDIAKFVKKKNKKQTDPNETGENICL